MNEAMFRVERFHLRSQQEHVTAVPILYRQRHCLINAVTAEVDLVEANFTGLATYQELVCRSGGCTSESLLIVCLGGVW